MTMSKTSKKSTPPRGSAPLKKLGPQVMARAEHTYREYFLDLATVPDMADTTLDDLLRPAFWREHVRKFGRFDVVRCRGKGFDVTLTVAERAMDGVVMELLP